jgi:hypothetical protein
VLIDELTNRSVRYLRNSENELINRSVQIQEGSEKMNLHTNHSFYTDAVVNDELTHRSVHSIQIKE